MPSLGKRKLEKIKKYLDQAELTATDLKNRASFGNLSQKYPITISSYEEADAFVKERICLWLSSWIASPIREALVIINEALNKD